MVNHIHSDLEIITEGQTDSLSSIELAEHLCRVLEHEHWLSGHAETAHRSLRVTE